MDNRSIHVGGSVIGGILNTGDNATIEQSHNQIYNSTDIDINQEIGALRELANELKTPDKGKIERALIGAEEEIAKPEPDKKEVLSALVRVIGYLKKAEEYSTVINKWAIHLTPIAIWLGLHANKFHF